MAIVISGTGLYTPEHSISNAELVESFNQYVESFNNKHADDIAAGKTPALTPSDAAFIENASGIKSRYVVNKAGILDPKRMAPHIPERVNEKSSVQCEMSIAAAKQALAKANKSNRDIDLVIVACSNLQRPYPAISIEVQAALEITGAAFDINVACSSATFGIETAVNAIKANSAKAALIISPEICTGHLNFCDRDSHFIFGDACTAVLVENDSTCTADHPFEILSTRLETLYSNNIRNNFGFLNRGDESGVGNSDKLFKQNGRKVFKEVVPAVSSHILKHLEKSNISSERLDRIWLHQANLSMNRLIGKKVLSCAINDEKCPTILDEYANTSSAGSIIAFHKHSLDLKSNALGIICSFGAGYSVGSLIVRKC